MNLPDPVSELLESFNKRIKGLEEEIIRLKKGKKG